MEKSATMLYLGRRKGGNIMEERDKLEKEKELG